MDKKLIEGAIQGGLISYEVQIIAGKIEIKATVDLPGELEKLKAEIPGGIDDLVISLVQKALTG